jgi:hypothetical protein
MGLERSLLEALASLERNLGEGNLGEGNLGEGNLGEDSPEEGMNREDTLLEVADMLLEVVDKTRVGIRKKDSQVEDKTFICQN